MPHGLLLINLGTPDSPDSKAVGRYLREFLMDKRVVDLPWLVRFILVNGLIAPFRRHQSASAYKEIWTNEGSPLLVYSLRLKDKLTHALGSTYSVALGMRYGRPNIASALKELGHCETLTILPLYPQYSSAATGSSIEATLKHLSNTKRFANLHVIRDFYQHPSYIQALAENIKPFISTHDMLLLSYHGLPTRHLEKEGCQPVCTSPCPPLKASAGCYRAQCYQTSASLAKALDLNPTQYTTSFQSRLGKTPWIKPYTDETLIELRKRGIKNLAVSCPAFVADCLETLEEIAIRAKAQWQALGGETLTLIPALNDNDLWVQSIINMIKLAEPRA